MGRDLKSEVKINYLGCKIIANYFRNREGIDGYIHFDKKGIKFSSSYLALKSVRARINYSDICKVKKVNVLGFIPSGFKVVLKNNSRHRFVVNKRDSVIDFLNYMVDNNGSILRVIK